MDLKEHIAIHAHMNLIILDIIINVTSAHNYFTL